MAITLPIGRMNKQNVIKINHVLIKTGFKGIMPYNGIVCIKIYVIKLLIMYMVLV